MGNFINEKQLVRHFPNREDTCLLNVGYDDFLYVKPLYSYRVQQFATWHFVLSGKGTLKVDEKEYSVKAGQMFFLPAGVKICYYPKENDPWEYFWFSMKNDVAVDYASALGFSDKNHVLNIVNFSKICSILKDLLEKERTTYFNALSGFYAILDICVNPVAETEIQIIKNHIDVNFSLPEFNVNTLCLTMGLSHAQLLRKFKAEYGMTVVKYLINKRMDYACKLLKTTDLSVKSVAYSCGFADEIHFMKTFKKEKGVSCLRYRNYDL